MRKCIILSAALAVLIAVSCTKKASPAKTAEDMPAKAPAVTYMASVKTLVQAKCTPCHIPANGGRKLALDTYDAVSKNIDDMLTRVQLSPTERGFMPFKNPALSAEEIAILKKWKEDGAKE
jgi:uncharacterized membrane protein